MAQGSVKPHIARDGTKTWRWRLAAMDPDTGKRRWSHWTFATKRELETFKAKKLAELSEGRPVHRSKKTVGDVLMDWLTLEAPHSGITATSLENYDLMVRKHLVPGLGAIAIQKLTTEMIERYYGTMLDANYARATVVLAHVCLRQALDRAVRHKLVTTNVGAVRMKMLSIRNRQAKARREMHTWTREECERFLEVGVPQSRYGPLWALILGTGVRRGEALGLRWSDLTLPDASGVLGQARVWQSLEPLATGAELMEPKDKEARPVPLVPTVVAGLRSYRETWEQKRLDAGDAWQPQWDLIFCRPDGSPLNPNSIGYDLKGLIAIASVSPLTIHSLRHTFATLALEAGVPIHVVSSWLGHSNVVVTMRVYAHVTLKLEERGASLLMDLFSGPITHQKSSSVQLVCNSCPFARPEMALHQR